MRRVGNYGNWDLPEQAVTISCLWWSKISKTLHPDQYREENILSCLACSDAHLGSTSETSANSNIVCDTFKQDFIRKNGRKEEEEAGEGEGEEEEEQEQEQEERDSFADDVDALDTFSQFTNAANSASLG